MRAVEFADGKIVKVRPMTVREIRSGESIGFGFTTWSGKEKHFEKAVRFALGQFDEDEIADLAIPDTRRLFLEVLGETDSAPGEEKNWSGSGPSGQTPSGDDTVTGA